MYRVEGLLDLPNDIFLLIASVLEAEDLIRCRRVSRKFYKAFTDDEFSRIQLRQRFPRARELQTGSLSQPHLKSTHLQPSIPASQLLSKVTARYHFLKK